MTFCSYWDWIVWLLYNIHTWTKNFSTELWQRIRNKKEAQFAGTLYDARFIFRGTQTLKKQIEYEVWLIKSCKRIVLGLWWKTLTMHNRNRNRYKDWYKQKAIKHILMSLMTIEVCADLCRLWECEDRLRGPAHGAGSLPPLSSISWHWPVSLQHPSTPTTCPAEAHQNLETNIKIL